MHPMSELTASMRRHRQELFALFMIAIVLLLLWLARSALPAFFIALALAFVLDPGVTALARRGVPRWAGVVILYATAVAVIWALLYFVVPPITRQANELVDQLPQLGAAVGDVERAIIEWYQSLPLPPDIRETIDAQIAASGDVIASIVAGLLAPTINAVVRAATFLARTRRHPGLALLRPEGPRTLQPDRGRGDASRLARGRREHAGPAGSRRRPVGARAAPPRARRSSWPPRSASRS